MKTQIGGIEIFAKAFAGMDCPSCGKQSRWLSTLNEWEYYCKDCDKRFNKNKQFYSPESKD